MGDDPTALTKNYTFVDMLVVCAVGMLPGFAIGAAIAFNKGIYTERERMAEEICGPYYHLEGTEITCLVPDTLHQNAE